MALYQRLKRQFLSRVNLVRVALGLAIVAGLLGLYTGVIRPLATQVQNLVKMTRVSLPKHDGRTNFLLLGIAGGDRAGALLTDTIIFASVDNQSGDTLLLSIPRDIWVPTMRAKINTAYYYGEQKQPGSGGLVLAKSAISEIVGQPVHYAAVISFADFEALIDLLGGVDVTVERAFVDDKFPIPGKEDDLCEGDPEYKCRYETLTFATGLQHMDGATALKFARSRQAEGDEGTDFARSKRQEKILLAIRNKLLSREILTNPAKIRKLYDQAIAAVKTDVTSDLYPALVTLGLKASKTNLRTTALDEQLFVNPPISATYDFQWVLVPKTGDLQSISDFVESQLKP